MDAPKIELRNIQHSEFASKETDCYQATLYVNGEAWGIVSNAGHGGCDDFHGKNGKSYADIRALNDWIKATMPPRDFQGMSLEQDLEVICGDLLNDWRRDKDFKRVMRSHVLFTKPDAPGIWQVKVKKPHTHATTITAIRAKHPDYLFLADLPESGAKAVYFAGA
jgi:hypothetical protein